MAGRSRRRTSKRRVSKRRARAAGLVHVDYHTPGITRRRCGRGFTFLDPAGRTVRGDRRDAIVALAIPPVWDDVWICPRPDGHLLATGVDPDRRRQYRYHPRWQALSSQTKFAGLAEFGRRLPKLRRQVRRDLNDPRLSHRRVTAGVVRLLDRGHVRVGSRRYFERHGTTGATTLTPEDVGVDGDTVELDFTGKSGRQRHVEIHDAKLADLLSECSELDGQFLLHYVDASGLVKPVRSTDVNRYLRRHTGRRVTAKDFRTWTGCVAALDWLTGEGADTPPGRSRAAAMVRAVSEQLGNTPAVCRSSYIDPGLLEAAERGGPPAGRVERRSELTVAESRFLAWQSTRDATNAHAA